MSESSPYLMESLDEITRLEIKTDPEVVRQQAQWCGVKPGMRVLDAGCGPGKTTAILQQMVQPGGSALGVDYSNERIKHAQEHYGQTKSIDFQVHDLRESLHILGLFDLIWVRFVLEYNRQESLQIIQNLTACLKPGGWLCLLDLDRNCLNHYEMPAKMEKTLSLLMNLLESEYNFDPYAGRKLYAYLFDSGYQNLEVNLKAHHLIYGKGRDVDVFNWTKKAEIASTKAPEVFAYYPGGHEAFLKEFSRFFNDPRRFSYTPLIMCKGRAPQ